jgi:hypothetical protein
VREAAVAVVHGVRQGIAHAGAYPDHRRLLDSEPHGDGVRSLEANVADVAGQALWVLGHDMDGSGLGTLRQACTVTITVASVSALIVILRSGKK